MNVLLFGATGSAGGSVLKSCLSSPAVGHVTVVTRRTVAYTHAKMRVHVHQDYLNYEAVARAFMDVDVCFFCLGISVSGVSGEPEYRRITHDFAVSAAHTLRRLSPDAVFHFLSAQGAHAKSRFMWARVKGETDQELIEKWGAVCWRPSAIDGEPSDHSPWAYQVFRPYFRVFKPFRSLYVSGADLGRAMIHAASAGMRQRIVPNTEIRRMAESVSAVSVGA